MIQPVNKYLLIQDVIEDKPTIAILNSNTRYSKAIVIDVAAAITTISIGNTILIETISKINSCVDAFCSAQGMYVIPEEAVVAIIK